MQHSVLWRLKLRLQFTGWLQYLPPALLALVSLIVAGLARLAGFPAAAIPFFVLGFLLLAVTLFDLSTVKLRLHPQERLPQRKEYLDVFELMRARRSCRSFQARQLTAADRQALIEAVDRHSAAGDLIGSAAIRFEYVAAALTVWPVVGATEFLVAIAPRAYNRLAVIDVGRSLQKIVLDATRMGLGTCWIGPGADQSSVARHLGERFNPQEDHIICVCAVGYQSRYLPLLVRIMNLQFHRRRPLAALFFADARFEAPLNVAAEPFSRFGRSYEVCQWAPSSYNGQTTRCVAVTEQRGDNGAQRSREGVRLERFDFYAATASRYYAPVAVGIWCANWELGCQALGIVGDFAELPAGDQAATDPQRDAPLPRYDVSWVLGDPLGLRAGEEALLAAGAAA